MGENTNQPLTTSEAAEQIYNLYVQEEPTSSETDEIADETVQAESEAETGTEATVEESEPMESEEVVEDEPQYGQFLSELNEWIADPDAASHFGEIRVKTKVNGQEGEATLADMVANYQIESAAEERLNSLKAEKSEFDLERREYVEKLSDELKQAQGLVEGLEHRFLSDYQNTNWEELRKIDPAEYAAKSQEAEKARSEIESYKTYISQKSREIAYKNYQDTIENESRRLVEMFPDWKDVETAKQEKTQIREYLLNSGFRPGEVDGEIDAEGNIRHMGLVDSRLVALAKKAYLYDNGKANVDVAKKRVSKVPKVVKPGKPRTVKEADASARKDQINRLKKTGKVEDAASLISQLL